MNGKQQPVQPKSPPRRAGSLKALALLGILGQALFVGVVALLPFFQPGYSSADYPISRLLLGPYGFVLSGALFAAGLGSLAIAVSIRRTTRKARGPLWGCVLIGLWALGMVLAGIVFLDEQGNPTESTSILHGTGVGLAFLAGPVGILVLSRVFARDARWSSFYPLSLALGFAGMVALIDMVTVVFMLSNLDAALGPGARRSVEGLGIIQRVFVGTVILWMVLAGVRLRSIAKDKSGRFSVLGRLVPKKASSRQSSR